MLNPLRRRDPAQAAVLFPRSTAPLHAMLTGAGRERRQLDGYDWHGLKRTKAEFALFQHTLAGRGRLTYEGREYTLEPGRTMLL
ncbi:AraC family ligand binding domain-containing protein, partial [Burkholderia sp. SIMBA_024]|uniref:AraC family ligand binding domain-containing protein n=1 Tax=Burkholderia sp. SIMBA_024 TaxID=3085768 RepID=UPI00397C04CE